MLLLLLLRSNSATKKPFVWSWAGLALRQWSAGRGRGTRGTCGQTTLKYLWSAPTYLVDQAHQHLLATAVPRQWDTSCMSVWDMISQPTCSLHLYPNGFGRDEGEGLGRGEEGGGSGWESLISTPWLNRRKEAGSARQCWHHSNVYLPRQYQTATTSTVEAVTKASIVKGPSLEH